jgi:S-DNA-T family DNA segregation ATPase FtsK/SpoIIIE
MVSWLERWRNWREERAELREEREARQAEEDEAEDLATVSHGARRGWFAAFFRRRNREPEIDPVDEIPAFQRAAALPAEEDAPIVFQARRASIWERAEEPAAPAEAVAAALNVATLRPEPVQTQATPPLRTFSPRIPELQPIASRLEVVPAAAQHFAGEIAIHSRADAEARTATVAPKNVSGFKLPPSTLLNPRARSADHPRRSTARRGQGPGRKMRRVRRHAGRWCRSIPVPWSPPTSSSRKPA